MKGRKLIMKKSITRVLSYLISLQVILVPHATLAEIETEAPIYANVTKITENTEEMRGMLEEDAGISSESDLNALSREKDINEVDLLDVSNLNSVHVDISRFFNRYSFFDVGDKLSSGIYGAYGQGGMYIKEILEHDAYNSETGLFEIDGLTYAINAKNDGKIINFLLSDTGMSVETNPAGYETLNLMGALNSTKGNKEVLVKLYYQGEEAPVETKITGLEGANSSNGDIFVSAVTRGKVSSTVKLSLYKYSIELDNTKLLTKIEIDKNSNLNLSVYAITLAIDSEGAEELFISNLQKSIDALEQAENLTVSDIADIEALLKLISDAEEKGYDLSEIIGSDKVDAAASRLPELNDIKEIINKIDELPNVTSQYTQEDFDEIENLMDIAKEKGYDTSLITNIDKFTKKKNDYRDSRLVGIPYDMKNLYNTSRIYSSVISFDQGNAGYAACWNRDSFISLPYWDEGTDWTKSDTQYMTFEDVRFSLYVPDCLNGDSSKNASFRNTFLQGYDVVKENEPYTNVDIGDGKYEKIAILANSERSKQGRLCIKLNYSDGSEEVFEKNLNFVTNSIGGPQITAKRNKAGATDVNQLANGYLPMITVPVDEGKVLVSFDILVDKYTFLKNEQGDYIFDENGKYIPVIGKGSSRDSYESCATVYAVTPVISHKNYRESVIPELEEFDSKLGDAIIIENGKITDVTSKGIEIFEKMGEILRNLDDEEISSSFKNYQIAHSNIPRFIKSKITSDFNNVEITFDFSVNMSDASEYVTILKNGEQFKEYKLKTEGKCVSIQFENDYDYESDYDVVISKKIHALSSDKLILNSDVSVSYNIPKVTELSALELRDEDGKNINDLSEYAGKKVTVNIKLQNANAGEKLNYTALVCLYDEEYRMIDVDRKVGVISKGETD